MKTRTKTRFQSLLIALCIAALNVHAEPLPGSELFVNAEISALRLSPNGSMMTAYASLEDGQKRIELMDLRKFEYLSKIDVGSQTILKTYYWLDDDTLYFETQSSRANVTVNQIGRIEQGAIKLNPLLTKGYLVDELPKLLGEVMFAKRGSNKSRAHELFIIRNNDLINGDFSRAKKIAHNDNSLSRFVYDSNYERLLSFKYDKASDTLTILQLPLTGGTWTELVRLKDFEFNFDVIGFISTTKLAVLSNENTDKIVLREYDLGTQKSGKILYEHPFYDLSGAGITADGQVDYVSYFEHGVIQYQYLDTGKARLMGRLKKTFQGQAANVIGTATNQSALVAINGSTEPGEYLLYDQNTDQAKRLLAAYPQLVGKKFARSEHIKTRARDGTEIEAFFTRPIGKINHNTLLVMPHGGPIGVRETDEFNRTVQYFASRGFSVLRVNFRGSSGYGKTFMERGVGEFGQLIESDITSVVNRIRRSNRFNHVCAVGASYGGYSATMLAIRHPDVYKCVVAGFGIFDLPLLYNASNYRSGEEYRKYIAKVGGEYSQELVKVSPVYQHSQLKTPILIIAGRDDDVADFEHSNRFNYVLEKAGHRVETMFYRNTAHGHKFWEGDRHQVALTSDYIMRTLGLRYPAPAELTAKGKQAYMEDFLLLGQGYHYDDIVDNDKQKSQQYYNLAGAYGYKPK